MADTLLFITDTHAGSDGTGFRQQTLRPDLLPQIASNLRQMAGELEADLLVHCGDITDKGEPQLGLQLLSELGLPVLACLGNHDLMTPDALPAWQQSAGESVQLADSVVRLEHVDVIALNCAWMCGEEAGFFWNRVSPRECLLQDQLEWLQQTLAADPQRPACIALHAPTDAIPVRLSGLPQPTHVARAEYAAALNRLLDFHPRVKLLLAGHNHVNCATVHGSKIHLTTASLIEAPFELRVVQFEADRCHVRTISALSADVPLIPGKRWVSGSETDRQFTIRF